MTALHDCKAVFSLHPVCTQQALFVRSEMECYAGMEKLAQDIERDEDWGPEMFEENEDDELVDDV